MAASNLNLGKASGGVLNVQPADGTTNTSLVLPAINGTVVAADSNGNVGIGVTPSAWGSGGWLEIASTAGLTAKGGLNIGSNWYYNNGYKYTTTAAASNYFQQNGQHTWYTAPSGTAGNAVITWTQAMNIENNTHTTIGLPVTSYTTGAQLRVEQAANNDASTASIIISRYSDNYSSALWHCYNSTYNNEAFNLSVSPAGGGSSLNTSYKKYMALGNGAHYWYGATTSNQNMTLDTSGNLGIGVTPATRLDVNGVSRIRRQNDLTTYLDITVTDVNVNYSGYDPDGYMSHQWSSNGSTKMTLDPSGNLNTNGIIRAGDVSSTNGSVVLTAKYDNGQNPNNLGTQSSSSAWELCFGVKPKPGSMGNYVSSVDNVSWSRGVLTVSNELSFKTASSTTTPIGSDVAMTERMRIDANGTLQTNRITIYNTAVSQGDGVINSSGDFRTYLCSADGSNAAATMARFSKNSTTSRSINAGGTINASGADYAEYEYSNDITLVKGQIVGFKEDGTLTDKYSESIRFAIKSTNPSIVGGDVWGCEEIVGKRPEQPVKSEEMTDEEFAKLEEQYEKDLADFEVRLETERQKVDRIAYAGKVPVNVYGAVAGQYVIAIEKEDGTIDGKLVNKVDMTFSEYQDAVGRVNKILDDGRAEVAVIIH